jgi:hypothetical protein
MLRQPLALPMEIFLRHGARIKDSISTIPIRHSVAVAPILRYISHMRSGMLWLIQPVDHVVAAEVKPAHHSQLRVVFEALFESRT